MATCFLRKFNGKIEEELKRVLKAERATHRVQMERMVQKSVHWNSLTDWLHNQVSSESGDGAAVQYAGQNRDLPK